LEGYILDEDFPLYPGGGEDEPTARLRASTRNRLVQDHNPTDRIRPRRVHMKIRSAVIVPECLAADSVADDKLSGDKGVVGSAEQIVAGETLLPR
jgi:hypothetical protein